MVKQKFGKSMITTVAVSVVLDWKALICGEFSATMAPKEMNLWPLVRLSRKKLNNACPDN